MKRGVIHNQEIALVREWRDTNEGYLGEVERQGGGEEGTPSLSKKFLSVVRWRFHVKKADQYGAVWHQSATAKWWFY